MKKNLKKILILIAVIAVLGGAGTGAYFIYEGMNYISTDNAQITANIISITPEVTGKLMSWDIKEGDTVKKDQVLGKQDISTLISSSSINSQTMTNSADSIAAKSEIHSPINGKIIYSTAVVGQVVAPGVEVAKVEDTANIYIKAYIKETDIFKIQEGQKVDITVDAHGNTHFNGYVMSLGQATQSAFSSYPTLNTSGEYTKETQLIPIKIAIQNPEELTLMPGMNAVIKIDIK